MDTTLYRSPDIATMPSNDSTPRQIDLAAPSNKQQATTQTLSRYMSSNSEDEIVESITAKLSGTRITSAFSTVHGANTPPPMNDSDNSDNEATPRPLFFHSTGGSLNILGDSISQCPGDEATRSRHHRRTSSLSTVSMSNVPSYLSAGQLLSPRGLSATSRLFESARNSESAKVYAFCCEDIVVGLGLDNVNVLDDLVEYEDIYEYCHSEESGGTPAALNPKKKGGKKRRRDGKDIVGYGDLVAIDHYHLDEDDYTDEGEDNDDEGIAQGGVALDLPVPFPQFDELTAVLLEATGGVTYTMPIGPTIPGTMEYLQGRRRARR